MHSRLAVLVAGFAAAAAGHAAGPYPPAAGQPGSTAIGIPGIPAANWASGFLDYQPGANVGSPFDAPARALGPATGDAVDVVSLGDSGRITLSFGGAIFDGPGYDFAVFENSFSDTFLELAWVEVSSDGTNFFRFPGFSFTANPIGSFGELDPTNLDGLAGKYRGGFGTPFDLALLASVPGLDVNSVQYVRIVDIVGDGSVLDNYPAQFGGPHPIYDPYPTTPSGAGFDLDAVGAIHLAPVPEPGTYALMAAGLFVVLAIARRRRAI